MLRILSCFALVALLLGCSIAGSELPDQLNGRARPEGVLYSLPRGVVTITLAVEEKRARFFLNVSDPEFIADPNHRYLLQHRPLPNFEDELKIKVNRRTFLTSVEVTVSRMTISMRCEGDAVSAPLPAMGRRVWPSGELPLPCCVRSAR